MEEKKAIPLVLPFEEISLWPELSSPTHFRIQGEVVWALRWMKDKGQTEIMRMYNDSWWFMTIHDNSTQFITAHDNSGCFMTFYDNSSQFIIIHDNSWRFIMIVVVEAEISSWGENGSLWRFWKIHTYIHRLGPFSYT